MFSRVVVDAMGSDSAPGPEIEGAIAACRQSDVSVVLAGPKRLVEPRLRSALQGSRLPIEVLDASEWITMDDKPAHAVRSKRQSSMRIGLRLVREAKATGFFTAGNTGAAMASAKMVLGMLRGIDRPALATIVPTVTGTPALLLDVGANVDSKPKNLLDFAVMGNIYAQKILHIPKPRVGLLSAIEDDRITLIQTKEAISKAELDFVGSVDSRDIFEGVVDVIVCDGFVGNVALKTAEGLVKLIGDSLRQSLRATAWSSIGALINRDAYQTLKKRLDHTEYGGAPLLGVRGACVIGHGSSDCNAIMNGVCGTAQLGQAQVSAKIAAAIPTSLGDQPPG